MAMFGQEIPKTKLIIVHSKTTAAFANYLQMLISSKKEQGDNDTGSADRVVETTIWSDEEYKAQKPTLSNQDHILFIGRSNVLSEEEYGIKKVFDRFQMQYGWLGRRAYLKVTGERLKKDQIQPYIEFAKKYDPDVTFESIFGLEAQAERRSRNGLQRFLETGKKYGFVGPGPIAVLENKKKKSLLRSNQYRTLTLAFYKEGLADFLKD